MNLKCLCLKKGCRKVAFFILKKSVDGKVLIFIGKRKQKS